MTITAQLRQQVPERAQYAGEFCEVTETDTGAELTIDHFHPQTLDGSDAVDNLLYCCVRCNQYKSDYWPIEPDDTPLWNPRQEPRTQHLLELSDGRIHPLTHIGGFTIHRLRLNRPPLVDHRLHKRQHAATTRLLDQYRTMLDLQEHLQAQTALLMTEQHQLLEQQRELLNLLLSRAEEAYWSSDPIELGMIAFPAIMSTIWTCEKVGAIQTHQLDSETPSGSPSNQVHGPATATRHTSPHLQNLTQGLVPTSQDLRLCTWKMESGMADSTVG